MRFLPVTGITLVLLVLLPVVALGQEESERLEVQVPSLKIGNEAYVPEGKLRLGPFRLHPFLSGYYGYDSNIYLEEKRPSSASVSTAEGGVRIDLIHKRQLFLAGYRAKYNSYDKKGARDNAEHEAELQARFRIGSFFLKLGDTYKNLFEPTPIYFKVKARREEHRGVAGIGFDTSKFFIEVSYGIRNYHFHGKEYINANNNQDIVSGELGYKFSPKTQIRLKGDYGTVDYVEDVQNDYTYMSGYLGLHYKVSGKLLSYLYLGYTSQSLGEEEDWNNKQDEEYSGLSAVGSLAYMVSKRILLSLTLLRELQYNASVNYTVTTKAQLTARYQLSQKFMVSLWLMFEDCDVPKEILGAFDATRMSAGASARYDLTRWLSAGVDIEYESRSSKMDYRSYSLTTAKAFLAIYF
jgi:hypothetical protein